MLMVLALVICLFGLVLIWSGSQSQTHKVNPDRVMMVQCIGIGLGFVGMIILSLIDFERFPWLWLPMAVFNVLFQLSLYFIGKEVGGNKSWIELPGGLNIQPGEIGKIIFIYTMACHMKLLREKINNFWSLVQLVLHMGVTMAAVFAIGPKTFFLSFLHGSEFVDSFRNIRIMRCKHIFALRFFRFLFQPLQASQTHGIQIGECGNLEIVHISSADDHHS